MFEVTPVEIQGRRACRMSGRLDALTAAQAQAAMEQMVEDGLRALVVDLGELRYVSSAGLRVFIILQKMLRKIGGRVVIYQPVEMVCQVFLQSGILPLFDLAANPEELAALFGGPDAAAAFSRKLEIDGIGLEVIERPRPPARLALHGSQDKLGRSAYDEGDAVAVPASRGLFGAGLGCFGENFAECRQLFGEAVLIEGSLFYQPAVARSGADFVLNLHKQGGLAYSFLNAFTFQGPFAALVAFDSPAGLVDLTRLLKVFHQVLPAPVLGLVLVAESKGLWGMHLKRAPVIDHQPADGREIYHPERFRDWMSLPVEPADAGKVVVATGLAAAERGLVPPAVLPWLPADADFHLHAAVFGKGPLGKRPEQLDDELMRIITELEALKVQHLLGRTQVAAGLAGLVALEA
ncbi:MAG: STAS domain-containing protein [Pseudomonadota bacterium]